MTLAKNPSIELTKNMLAKNNGIVSKKQTNIKNNNFAFSQKKSTLKLTKNNYEVG